MLLPGTPKCRRCPHIIPVPWNCAGSFGFDMTNVFRKPRVWTRVVWQDVNTSWHHPRLVRAITTLMRPYWWSIWSWHSDRSADWTLFFTTDSATEIWLTCWIVLEGGSGTMQTDGIIQRHIEKGQLVSQKKKGTSKIHQPAFYWGSWNWWEYDGISWWDEKYSGMFLFKFPCDFYIEWDEIYSGMFCFKFPFLIILDQFT